MPQLMNAPLHTQPRSLHRIVDQVLDRLLPPLRWSQRPVPLSRADIRLCLLKLPRRPQGRVVLVLCCFFRTATLARVARPLVADLILEPHLALTFPLSKFLSLV
eukprot:Rmarinus@m.8465